MKKCNRCSNVIDWEKSFCPLCGGQVTDVQKPARPEPVIAPPPAAVENIGIPQVAAHIEPPSPPAPHIEPPSPPAPQMPPALISAVPPPPAPIPSVAMIPPVQPPAPPQPIPAVPAFGQDMAMPQAGFISQIHDTPGATAPFTPPPPPPGGMFSQIHQSPGASLPTSQPEEPSFEINQKDDPLSVFLKSAQQSQAVSDAPQAALLGEESNFSSNIDAAQFEDQIEELLKRGAQGTDKQDTENPIEALLQSGPKFNFDDNSEIKDYAQLFPSVDGADEEPPQFSPPAFDSNEIPNLPDDAKPDPDGNNAQDDFLRMFPRAKG